MMITESDTELLCFLKSWGLSKCQVVGGTRDELGGSDSVADEDSPGGRADAI